MRVRRKPLLRLRCLLLPGRGGKRLETNLEPTSSTPWTPGGVALHSSARRLGRSSASSAGVWGGKSSVTGVLASHPCCPPGGGGVAAGRAELGAGSGPPAPPGAEPFLFRPPPPETGWENSTFNPSGPLGKAWRAGPG